LELTEGRRKLYREELRNIDSSRSITRMVKSKGMGRLRHAAGIDWTRNVYKILVGKSQSKKRLGTLKCR